MDKNLYKITNLGNNSFDVVLSDESHEVFKAHFPNNPILPGFIFLHICEKALGIVMTEAIKAKFISFAKPNDILILNISKKETIFSAEFKCKDKKICALIFKGDKIE